MLRTVMSEIFEENDYVLIVFNQTMIFEYFDSNSNIVFKAFENVRSNVSMWSPCVFI